MKLYYSKGACSLGVRITLHELDIPCEFESVNFKTKQTESGADFLKINPKGYVPTLVTNKHEILTENMVIQQYLADEFKAAELLPPIGTIQRYRVLEWLNYVSTELHKGCGPLFNSKLAKEVKDTFFIPDFKNKLSFVDQKLSENQYITQDHFTVADSYLFVILTWLPHFQFNLSEWKNLSRYFSELSKRKSVAKALQEENLTV